jgi:peroxiredoxin
MEINGPADDFELCDLDGASHRLRDYRGRIVVVNFWSCECPHSERTDGSMLASFAQWGEQVALMTIAANANEPVEAVRAAAQARHLPLVLLDPGHRVADLYQAQATPHTFVLDREGILRYRGTVDNVGFRQREASRFYVKEAVEALLEGRLPAIQEQAPFGCAIVRDF